MTSRWTCIFSALLKGPCNTYHELFGMHFVVKYIVPDISSHKNYSNPFSITGVTRGEKLRIIVFAPFPLNSTLATTTKAACSLSGDAWHLRYIRPAHFLLNVESSISGEIPQGKTVQALVPTCGFSDSDCVLNTGRKQTLPLATRSLQK